MSSELFDELVVYLGKDCVLPCLSFKYYSVYYLLFISANNLCISSTACQVNSREDHADFGGLEFAGRETPSLQETTYEHSQQGGESRQHGRNVATGSAGWWAAKFAGPGGESVGGGGRQHLS